MKVLKRGIDMCNIKNNVNLLTSKKANLKALDYPKMSFHTNDFNDRQSNRSINNSSLFYLTSKKNFFEKLKESFIKQKQHRLKQIIKEEEYYVPQDNIVFVNKKYQLMEAGKNFTDSIKLLQKFILYPVITVSSLLFLRAFVRIKIISLLFSGFVSFTSLRMNFGINQNKKHIIIKIFLLENGKECEIHTLENVFTTDIKNIRRLQVEEGLYLASNIQNMVKNYIPLAIDTRLYLIPLVAEIQNQEILSAVSNGKYIRTDEVIDLENSIDIDNEEKHKH